MSRSRASHPVVFKHGKGNDVYAVSNWNLETMWESSYPGPCSVNHVKVRTPLSWSRPDGIYWENGTVPVPSFPNPDKLNWGKLPTSTEFGLIQMFAELDDSLALFTKRFWKQLSYGSFTWGVLPFVSEMKGLLEGIANLGKNTADFEYGDIHEQSVAYDRWVPAPGNAMTGTLDLKFSNQGRADISFQDGASQWLDRLGFHPDLNTAWDLVPLSFVLDWFLPVGSFLDSLRSDGWVKVAVFNGWQSCKWTWKGTFYDTNVTPNPSCPFEVSGYTRYPSSTILTVPTKVDIPSLTEPTRLQMFNTAYIAANMAGVGTKLKKRGFNNF